MVRAFMTSFVEAQESKTIQGRALFFFFSVRHQIIKLFNLLEKLKCISKLSFNYRGHLCSSKEGFCKPLLKPFCKNLLICRFYREEKQHHILFLESKPNAFLHILTFSASAGAPEFESSPACALAAVPSRPVGLRTGCLHICSIIDNR